MCVSLTVSSADLMLVSALSEVRRARRYHRLAHLAAALSAVRATVGLSDRLCGPRIMAR
jgi:hypothetical protein